MTAAPRVTIVLLHRDLRTEDHATLRRAADIGAPVLPIFVFSRKQTDAKKNDHFAPNSFSFLVTTLRELASDLPSLTILQPHRFDPTQSKSWRRLLAPFASVRGHVLTSWDATPFARRRADALSEAAAKLGWSFEEVHNLFLVPAEELRTQQGGVYRVFTPFRNAVRQRPVPAPCTDPLVLPPPPPLPEAWKEMIRDLPEAPMKCPQPVVRGGRAEAQQLLQKVRGLRDYDTIRDDVTRKTSLLGAHLKYGTLSVRHVWHRVRSLFGDGHGLLDQLIWRDWFAYAAYHRGDLGILSTERFQRLRWSDAAAVPFRLERWRTGTTGVPLVDAGMRQLVANGWIGNRVRMVVADFLVKVLRVPWQEGERFFSKHLIDYDPSSNVGSWDWTVTDLKYGKPRVFNPFAQAQRHDPEAVYIRNWVPELRAVPARAILHWDRDHGRYTAASKYPAPIVDYSTEIEATMEAYRAAATE